MPAVATSEREATETESIGPPVAVFHFKYRPLAILQAQEIAPRPSQSLSASDEEPIANSDDRDARIEYLQAKCADMQRELEALQKKRPRKNGEGPRKKVRREPIVGVTIDLTED
ncbi:hypothetical protein V5O48_018372 [Marasmius crinis-equi]|uniref:Uncharacterized protein n=1 Tax=Marasmius crinis-equi TaxID=585013 RepID=A0ABR3ELD6_9AGAR